MLEHLRPALRIGLKRIRGGFVGPGEFGLVISENLAQQLIDCGMARLERGRGCDRLVLQEH